MFRTTHTHANEPIYEYDIQKDSPFLSQNYSLINLLETFIFRSGLNNYDKLSQNMLTDNQVAKKIWSPLSFSQDSFLRAY